MAHKAVVVGGGLAGCEGAWQLAERGVDVTLLEMKPIVYSKAHSQDGLAELVCSNSLKASRVESAAGLLKEEMRRLGSLLVPCALETAVSAGGALAVDREAFSKLVTKKITEHPHIELRHGLIEEVPEGPVIVATGPLTADGLAEDISRICGSSLSFYDAAAPIVTRDSLDFNKIFAASRYDRGEADYLNCPMNKEEYEAFWEALCEGEQAPLHDFDRPEKVPLYEGCMPIELLARRGKDSIRYGPMKPVGLTDPHTGRRPYAVVQLRAENRGGSMYNLVGFQTSLKFPEQKRIFSMIPGLEKGDFVRYGVMHRNSFIDSPRILRGDFSLKPELGRSNLYFAGQITGVEGYMESAASGLMAGLNLARAFSGLSGIVLPKETMIGSLARYISDSTVKDFQPMGANMGLLPPLENHIRNKQEKYGALSNRALEALDEVMSLF